MDRMLYLAMTAAKQTMTAQSVNNNNLANLSTTAFKEDLAQFRSMPVFGEGVPSRVYAMTERPGVNTDPGPLNRTGRDLDVAIRDQGWIAVQAPDGNEAYTRAGDLRINDSGLVVNGAGHPVIGNGGGPITVPPAEKVEIGTDGTITVRPVGQDPNVLAEVDRIKLVNPPAESLTKGEDGLIRLNNGDTAPADAGVNLVSGALEKSNVSAVDSMVRMIELSRQYEAQIKMMKAAQESEQATDKLISY